MPARSKSNNTNVSQPNIVLLEEYDALAAAIPTALRKFAPQHACTVARSIKELGKLAPELDPDLFIFDVDPPWAGITDCLEQLRDWHPKARALVIGTALPPEIAVERSFSGGLQFIQKPFELATFGAAVQALLGPWRESESRGTLRALGIIDILLLHCAAGVNVIVDVRSRTRTGEIHVVGGQVSHAEAGKLKGEDALAAMLGWPKSHFSERKFSGSPRRTISSAWPTIVVEALREAQSEISEPQRPQPPVTESKTGKRLVVIDDTEMLLIFVEDVLATAEPDWQITTAVNGSEGLRAIERVNPDIVLLDYNLPDFNGDEVCRRLLENERTASVPVLMMSGHVAQMNMTAQRFRNVVETIEKPFLSDALVELVRRTIASGKSVAAKNAPRPDVSSAIAKPAAPLPKKEAPPKPIQPPPPQPLAPPPPVVRESVVRPRPREEITPPPVIAREPVRIPIESRIEQRKTAATAPAISVAPTDGSGAILGLFLEVISMQLTSQLQMGAIRARPASLMASLRLESAAARNAIPAETGFQIGAAQFSSEGRISVLRLLPTLTPLQRGQTRNAFEIGGVAVIPNETRARVQLTPAGTTPMTMELWAHLELSAVELTPNFQVAQLILNWITNAVRVTLNPKSPEQTAARFQMRIQKLDSAGRIAELLLTPIKQ